MNKPKRKDWREKPVPRDDFQCACGCELRLSAGDLADAMRLAAAFGGAPRTYGVTFTSFPIPRDLTNDVVEPVERRPCSGCPFTMVEVPVYLAKMLHDKGSPWPRCEKCRPRPA